MRKSARRQTATAEVLSISRSCAPYLAPVFQAMLENATGICEAQFGSLSLSGAPSQCVVALHNAQPACAKLQPREPIGDPTGLMGRVSDQAITSNRGSTDRLSVGGIYKAGPLFHIHNLTTQRLLPIVPLLKDRQLNQRGGHLSPRNSAFHR